MNDEKKPAPPFQGFGVVVLIVLVALAAYFLVLPLGREVAFVLQKITDTFAGR